LKAKDKAADKMGCASSKPAAADAGAARARGQGTLPAAGGVDAKANTRARRLSYVTNNPENGGLMAGDGERLGPGQAPGSEEASKQTRGRRLSYVTAGDPAISNMLQAAYAANYDESAGEIAEIGRASSSAAPPAAAAGPAPAVPAGSLRINVACMSRAGREPGYKKTNQDNCFAFEKYITEDQSLFGTMDGHGPHGHLVSGFLKQHLPIMLVNHLTAEADPRTALSRGFIEVDKALGASRVDVEFSGSTCVVAFLKGRMLTTAWVGDSRGVVGRRSGAGKIEAVDLTNDHKPASPGERERILACNGRVEKLMDENGQPLGPHRVWLQYAWIPGLAMSRALGDALAHQVGVISDPEHTVNELGPADKFIVLASDGVWEFISSQEAVDIIAQYDTAEEACRQLVEEAYQRWVFEEEGVVDDITAVIVKLNW